MLIIILIIIYLYASIPFPYIFYYLKTGEKLTEVGTKNNGIANMFKHGGPYWGLLALSFELLKLIITFALYNKFFNIQGILYLMILVNIFGIMYPIFLKFKGGKARTTSGWALFILSPLSLCILGAIWLLGLLITKQSYKPYNITLLFVGPVIYMVTKDIQLVIFAMILSLVFYSSNSLETDDFYMSVFNKAK